MSGRTEMSGALAKLAGCAPPVDQDLQHGRSLVGHNLGDQVCHNLGDQVWVTISEATYPTFTPFIKARDEAFVAGNSMAPMEL